MFPKRLLKTTLRCRRLVTGVALVAYLGNVWGFPLPLTETKDVAVAFPCQGHACGCHSAAQCWQDCCCHTPAQRLAWAKAHGVTIPAETRQELLAASEQKTSKRSCCQHEHKSEESLHCERDSECSHGHVADSTHRRPQARGWVLGIEARKCRGLSTEWIAGGATLPLEIQNLWEFDWTPVGRIELPTAAPRLIAFTPPVPPPQI